MRVPCSNQQAVCAVCGTTKKPVGRSAPLEMANSLCDSDCDGYYTEPLPPTRWPGEECDECDAAPKAEEGEG
jgi:hypothetical protein